MPKKTAMPRLKSAGARLYHAALYLYPPAFRREFSSEMARDFDESIEDTRLTGRWRDLLALGTQTGADLVRSVLVQWLRTGLPILLLCSIVCAIVAASVAANVLPRGPIAVPTIAPDQELITLILLASTVLLVIAETIVFTCWFSRRFLQRHRR